MGLIKPEGLVGGTTDQFEAARCHAVSVTIASDELRLQVMRPSNRDKQVVCQDDEPAELAAMVHRHKERLETPETGAHSSWFCRMPIGQRQARLP